MSAGAGAGGTTTEPDAPEQQPGEPDANDVRLAERVRRQQERRQAEEDREPRSGADVVAAAARGDKLKGEEQLNATDWFLSDEEEAYTEELEINVGTRSGPKWITFEIQPVDADKVRRIRKQSTGGTRAQRRTGTAEIDETVFSCRMIVEGTVVPDLAAIAKQQEIADPSDVVRKKFQRKPGLLQQISGAIMDLSGFDEEDLREVDAGKP